MGLSSAWVENLCLDAEFGLDNHRVATGVEKSEGIVSVDTNVKKPAWSARRDVGRSRWLVFRR